MPRLTNKINNAFGKYVFEDFEEQEKNAYNEVVQGLKDYGIDATEEDATDLYNAALENDIAELQKEDPVEYAENNTDIIITTYQKEIGTCEQNIKTYKEQIEHYKSQIKDFQKNQLEQYDKLRNNPNASDAVKELLKAEDDLKKLKEDLADSANLEEKQDALMEEIVAEGSTNTPMFYQEYINVLKKAEENPTNKIYQTLLKGYEVSFSEKEKQYIVGMRKLMDGNGNYNDMVAKQEELTNKISELRNQVTDAKEKTALENIQAYEKDIAQQEQMISGTNDAIQQREETIKNLKNDIVSRSRNVLDIAVAECKSKQNHIDTYKEMKMKMERGIQITKATCINAANVLKQNFTDYKRNYGLFARIMGHIFTSTRAGRAYQEYKEGIELFHQRTAIDSKDIIKYAEGGEAQNDLMKAFDGTYDLLYENIDQKENDLNQVEHIDIKDEEFNEKDGLNDLSEDNLNEARYEENQKKDEFEDINRISK